jgi:hypothetical protein
MPAGSTDYVSGIVGRHPFYQYFDPATQQLPGIFLTQFLL